MTTMRSDQAESFQTPKYQARAIHTPPSTPHPEFPEIDYSRLQLPQFQLPNFPVEEKDQVLDKMQLPKLLPRSVNLFQSQWAKTVHPKYECYPTR